LQEPLPATLELPVLTQGDKASDYVVNLVAVAAPVVADASNSTIALTLKSVIHRLLAYDSGGSLKGTAGVQEVASGPMINDMETSGAHYSLDGEILPPQFVHAYREHHLSVAPAKHEK
jgi:hypothetical protein